MRWFSLTLLFLLCIFSGSQWLLLRSDTSVVFELGSLAVGTLFAAILADVFRSGGVTPFAVRNRCNWKLALSGIGAVGAPTLLLLAGRQSFSSVMAVATEASLPVVVAVAVGVTDVAGDLQKRLMPGLIALAGTLLVLPVGLPRSFQGWRGFALYLLAALLGGVCSILCHREMNLRPRGSAVAIVIGANAILFVAATLSWLIATGQWHSLNSLFTTADLFSVFCITGNSIAVAALLQLLPPIAAASRMVFIPLIATLEAYIILRPTLSLRSALGALLMLWGGLACVRGEAGQSSATHMSLR